MCDSIYMRNQTKLIYGDSSQNNGHILGRVTAVRAHKGAFWDAENVLYLDLGGGYTGCVYVWKFIELHT